MNVFNSPASYNITSSWVPGLTTYQSEPTITLKRGRVEIDIKHASAIVQRMEELFPKTKNSWGYHTTSPSEVASADHEWNKSLVVAAKNWFKQELYGTNQDDFEIVISEGKKEPMEETKQTPPFVEEPSPTVFSAPPVSTQPTQHIEKTVNKNAYEIRTDILGMALDWVKFKKDCNNLQNFSDEDILSTAQKFYRFVENKR